MPTARASHRPKLKSPPSPLVIQRSEAHAGWFVLAVFAASLVILLAALQVDLKLGLDEGIYLTGASQVARGLVPYRDFFALTGPGTFWFYGIVSKLSGNQLSAAHFVLYAEASAIVACAFYFLMITTKSRVAAWLGAAFLLATIIFAQYRLYVNHRWDSLFFSCLSVALILAGQSSKRKVRVVVIAGIVGMLGAVMTPPVLLVQLAVVIALAWESSERKTVLWYAAGAAVAVACILGYLAITGALAPALSMMEWNRGHYSTPNSVGFGQFSVDAALTRFNKLTYGMPS